jgi:hypothetical protein
MTKLRVTGAQGRTAETASQNIAVGLHTIGEFNQSIRYADSKAAALAAAQGLAATVLATHRDGGPGGLLPTLLFTAGLAGVLISAALLAAGQVPRLSSGATDSAPNRLAFPSLARMQLIDILKASSPANQREDAWRQAADLAKIAMTKYRWLHRALVSTIGTLATVLLWLGVVTWLR